MSRPIPDGDTAEYEVEVTVKFYFIIEAEDDMQAEEIASYDWQDNLYHGEIQNIRVDIIEEDDDDVPEYGDLSDAGMDGA